MNVADAICARHSVRAFLDTPVSKDIIEEILETTRQSPSGGNVQPWHVYVLCGDDLAALLPKVQASIQEAPQGEPGAYDIYPKDLKEPYKARRARCGEDMYASISIPKEDKMGRIVQVVKNYEFFGAPVGLFFTIDETMGRPQWAHLGMFIQTFMLLATESGFATCPQEAWALRHQTIRDHLDLPDDQILYCGMALGYEDEEAPINDFRTQRAAVSEFTTFRGF